ncbi:MAG: tetratricopeptide repeat protein, partial [Verrucomicrobiota bacterium]
NQLAFAAGTAIAAALVIGFTTATWMYFRESDARKRATQAEKLATQRLVEVSSERDAKEVARQEAEAISTFMSEVFQSPDPARDGRTITVAETLAKAAKKLETELAGQPARRAKLQAALGNTYRSLGLARDGISLQEKARDYFLASVGSEHPETLAVMRDLADSYHAAGRRAEALKLFEEILVISIRVLGPEHPGTLSIRNRLTVLYGEAGRQNEAFKLQEELLVLTRKVLGQEHPETLTVMNNLSGYYNNQFGSSVYRGRGEEINKLAAETLALRHKVLGPEHPATILAMIGQAYCYFDDTNTNADRDKGLKLMEEALALSRKVNGPEHPDTLQAMRTMAVFMPPERDKERMNLLEDTLALSRKVNTPEHPETVMCLVMLGKITDIDIDKEQFWEEALALSRKVNDPEHQVTIWIIYSLARCYESQDRWREAVQLREELLALRRKGDFPGLEYDGEIDDMVHLADAYRRSDRRDDALKLLDEALQIFRKTNHRFPIKKLIDMCSLARSLSSTGRPEDALKLWEEALVLSRNVYPHLLDDIRRNLVDSYEDAKRWEDAVKLREELLISIRASKDPESLVYSMNRLMESYTRAGRLDEALRLGEEALSICDAGGGAERMKGEVIAVMTNLMEPYMRAGRLDEALRLGEEALSACDTGGVGEWAKDWVIRRIINVHKAAGRPDLTLQLTEDALRRREETFERTRQANGPDDPETLKAMRTLAGNYEEAGKQKEAESLRDAEMAIRFKKLPPLAQMQKSDLPTLRIRADHKGRRGEWKEALADKVRLLDLDPDRHYDWYQLSPLLVQTNDVEGYRDHRRKMLEKFAATMDLPTMGLIAKASLILPVEGADLEIAAKLANTAATRGKTHEFFPHFQFIEGLAAYRQGRFAEAIAMQKSVISALGPLDRYQTQAYAVLAMAHHRLDQASDAQAALSKCSELAANLPTAAGGNFGDNWHDVLIAQFLLREAQALIGEK